MNSKFSKNIKMIIALAVALMIGLGGFGYYEYVYKRTPSYSLMLIGKSVREHNVEEFNKHVDVKDIVGNYLDEQYQKDPSIAADPFAKIFWEAISNVAKEAVASRVNDMVAGKDIGKDAKGGDNPIVQKVAKKGKEKGKMSLVSVEKQATNPDGTAQVKIVMKNEEKNKEETALVMMRPLEDGSWQIYKVNNIEDLLKE